MCNQVDIKRALGVPSAHGTADVVRGHPALVKPRRELRYAAYGTHRHLLLDDVQVQGGTADGQSLVETWFAQVSIYSLLIDCPQHTWRSIQPSEMHWQNL